jgi:hypothetical protein
MSKAHHDQHGDRLMGRPAAGMVTKTILRKEGPDSAFFWVSTIQISNFQISRFQASKGSKIPVVQVHGFRIGHDIDMVSLKLPRI